MFSERLRLGSSRRTYFIVWECYSDWWTTAGCQSLGSLQVSEADASRQLTLGRVSFRMEKAFPYPWRVVQCENALTGLVQVGSAT